MNNLILNEFLPNGIAVLTLNRPERHNAFDDKIIKLLTESLMMCENNTAVKVLILKANGKNFSAGADLDWMKRMIKYTKEENLTDALQLANLLKILNNMTKPTIALVQGNTMGGGIGLLSSCDMVVAEEKSRFCFSETKLGLVPATIAPYVIQSIGQRAAKYYFLTGKFFSCEKAKQLGLVQEIVAQGDLFQTGMELASSLLKNGPQSLAIIKQLVSHLCPFNETALNDTAKLIANVRTSAEAQEGLSAFIEKREPTWNN